MRGFEMRRIFLCGAAVAVMGIALPAMAQSTAESSAASQQTAEKVGLTDIVVTAQRREERLQDVPVSVAAISGEALASTGVSSTLDLAQVTPGVNLTYIAGNTMLRLRGVGSSAFGPGVESPSATYVDGVYIASTGGQFFNLANIERIEVLKGPQGTLFGRNATGGLVHIITPDPNFTTQGKIRITGANYETFGGDMYLTGGLSDKVAADLQVHYMHQGKGWGTNINTGKDTNQIEHELVVRSKMLFEPTDGVKFILAGDYGLTQGSYLSSIQNRDTTCSGCGIYAGVYELLLTNRLDANPANDLPYINHGGFYGSNQTNGASPGSKNQAYGLALTGEFDLSDSVLLKSITAFRRTSFVNQFDVEHAPVPFVHIKANERWMQFSQELQLSSQGSGPLQWTAGLYYFHANDQFNPLDVTLYGSAGGFLFNGDTSIANALSRVDSGSKTNSYSAYAQGTYEFLPDTSITLGGRYTKEDRSAYGTQGFRLNFVDGTSFDPVPFDTPFALTIPGKVKYNNFSYRIALDHKFSRDFMVYASYSTGFKSGGFNLTVPDNPPFKPEKLKAWEIGAKTEFFDNHVRLNLAAYSYDYTGIQVNNYTGTSTYITNGAAARIKGVEADLTANPFTGFLVNASAAYTHDRFTDYPDADYNFVVPDCNYSNPSPSRVCQASAKGNKLQNTPTFTWNVGFSYDIPVGDGAVGATGNYSHNSGFFGTTDNFSQIKQEPYDVVNASIYWEPQKNSMKITLFAKNMFGEKYSVNRLISSGQSLYVPAAPGIYGVSIETKF